MADQGELPAYEEVKGALGVSENDLNQRVRDADPDATVVVLCHFKKNQPNVKGIIGSCHVAILLPEGLTWNEVMRNLRERAIARAAPLKMNDHDLPCGLAFCNGNSTPSEIVTITDEETWQACRILLRRTEGSRLMFYCFARPPSGNEDGARGEKTKKSFRSGKKCVVQ